LSQAVISAQLPFELTGYSVDSEVRAFRASEVNEWLPFRIGDYLQLTGALGRMNFFGVQGRPPGAALASRRRNL